MDHARLRSASGFALVEAIISAAVLAVISLAILAGIDGAAASSGREKARAVASSLAEADQERLRALPVTTLAQYAATSPYVVPDPTGATKTVDGVTYTVTSKAQWIRDDTSDSVSCTTDSHAADYFHITSTVTSTIVGTRIAPVTIDSILAPNVAYSSTRGTLAVKVVDAKGSPLAGKLVTITGGTPPAPQQTNALGCAVFQQIAADPGGTTYTANLSDTGRVDHFGDSTPSKGAVVTPGKLTLITMPYDVGQTITANVVTYAPGATPASPGAQIPSAAAQLSAVNSGETGMLRTYPQSGEVATIKADTLFPFPQSYTFFTGTCHYNDPTDSTNYTTLNTTGANAALIAGQQVAATALTATVVQPPLNLQITRGPGSSTAVPTTSMTVKLYPSAPSTDSCVQPNMTTLKTFDVDSTAAYNWMVGRSYNTTTKVLDAGVPFGKYTVCFQSGTSYFAPGTVYDNSTPPTGQATTVSYSGWSGSTSQWKSGTCP
jgi:Tfp pilus assembly protein PilV